MTRPHWHPEMAEPCVVPDEPIRYRAAAQVVGLAVFLLVEIFVIVALVFAGQGAQ